MIFKEASDKSKSWDIPKEKWLPPLSEESLPHIDENVFFEIKSPKY